MSASITSLNFERYFQFFDQQKFTSLNEYGTVFHDYQQFEKVFRLQIPQVEKYNSLEFSNVKMTILNPRAAVLVNEYTAEVMLKSSETVTAKGAGTQVWSKSTGLWKLVNVSSSVNKAIEKL